MSREQLLAEALVELADTLDDDFESLDALQILATRSSQLVGAAAAAVSLVDLRGALQLVASTTHAADAHELIAIAAAQGPGAEAFGSGESVVNLTRPAVARRWPEFTAAADRLGYRSPHFIPLRLRSEVLGVLTVLFEAETWLDETELSLLESLAAVATIGLLRERTPRQKELLAERIQTTLQLRIVVEQAKGVVAELTGVDMAESFKIIESLAERERQPISEVAVAVLEGRLRAEELRRLAT